MKEPLLRCQKCGAVMVQEGYHEYGWYIEGQKVECCHEEAESTEVKVGRDDLRNILAALEKAGLKQEERQQYQRLLAALEGK